jgi:hypothetical protein
MANLIVSAVSTFDNKGLKKGQKEVTAFEKRVKSFAKTFAAAFSVTALTRYGKAAVNAFVADEKAAKSLEQQLKNTGYQFSSPAIELYISNLQRTSAVLDDQLRPAFQQLLTVTGSITKSQDALNTALNVAAATGKSVTEVSAALARGYAGQTTGLSRLNAGLSKATLKAGDMDAILAELNAKFSGQAQARLTTYAGKMDLLKVASENVKEEIGKGILGALAVLGEDTNIEKTTKKMEDLAKQTSDTTIGFGKLLKTLGDIPGLGMIGKAFYETSTLGLLARLGRENRPPRELPANEQRSASRIFAQQFRTETRQAKELARLKALELAQLKKKTEVDKLAEQFNITLIGLTKALSEETDKETKARINALIAIEKNDDALAKKAAAELAAATAAAKLAGMYDQALESVKLMNAKIAAFLTSMSVKGFDIPGLDKLTSGGNVSSGGGGGGITGTLGGSVFDPSFARRGEERSMAELKITVDTQATGDRFAALIAESLQIAQKSGVSYGIAGGL